MTEFPTTLLITMFALALVLVMAWLILKALAGFSKFNGKQSGFDIRSSLPLGSRERLIVISYRGSEYLLGVTTSHISILDKLTAEEKKPTDNP